MCTSAGLGNHHGHDVITSLGSRKDTLDSCRCADKLVEMIEDEMAASRKAFNEQEHL